MKYLKKKDPTKKVARDNFEKQLIVKVRKYLRDDFGKHKWVFNDFLVGSARCNLVLVGNEGFDLDYQLRFEKMPENYLNDAKATKELFSRYFNRANSELSLGLKNCEDSTHVLTMKKIMEGKIVYSYDIAILRLDANGQYIILKNEKKQKPDDYHYVQLADCTDFNNKYKKINNSKKWDSLREKYKAKKEAFQNTNKYNWPHSFSLLGQAVNEVLQE